MRDLECPYCGKEHDVCHDDGFGYDEGVKHEMWCDGCDKNFIFETSISFYYEAYSAECLNDDNHKFEMTHTQPSEYSMKECVDCGKRVSPTKEELELHINELNKKYKK
jgi:DNA-directed RNA polymerase subunit RPC12/RpoP